MENKEKRQKTIISELIKDEKARDFFEKIKNKMSEIARIKREESITKEYTEFEKARKYLSERDISEFGLFGEKAIGDGMRFEKVVDKGVKIEESYLTTSGDENPYIQEYERKKQEVDQLDKEITELEKKLKKAEANILLTAFSKNHNEKIDMTKQEIEEKKKLREAKVPSESEEKLYKLLMTMSDEEKASLLENLKIARQTREAYLKSYSDQIGYDEKKYSRDDMDKKTEKSFEEVFNEALLKVLEDENIDIQEITEKIGQTTDSATDKESSVEENDKFLSNIVKTFINEKYKNQQEKNEMTDKETLRKQLIERIKRKLEEIKGLQKELENNTDEKNIEEQKED